MQEHMTLVGQVHVDAVGAKVIGHRQLVVAMVTHLLHDLPRSRTGLQHSNRHSDITIA